MGKRKSSPDAATSSAQRQKTEPFKILISDKLADAGVTLLKDDAAGFTVDVRLGMKPADLIACIGEYDALIVRSGTQVTAEVFQAAAKGRGLKAVGRAGTGVDNIDLKAATSAGCVVMNAPGGNALAAAEHTCALLFSLTRHLAQANQTLREGKWERKAFMGVELAGKTLGIAGLGRIGREVARRALACRMNLVGYDPYLPQAAFDANSVEKCDTLADLFAKSDFITLHMPLTDETANMVSEETIKLMKKDVRIINCARGGLIDGQALLDGLKSGKVAGAAIDVFEVEPPKDDVSRALIEHPRVLTTPHLGASTKEAQDRCGVEIAGKVAEFLQSGAAQDSVNYPSIPRDKYKEMEPVMVLAETLGRFVASIADGSPKALSVRCFGTIGASFRSPLSIAVVKGVVSAHTDAGLCELVNAMAMAEERGLSVEDSHSTEKTAYAGLLRVRLTTDKGTFSVAGTVFASNTPRLVELETVAIDCELETGAVMLVNRNKDVPGVVGKVGTALGSGGVNILGLQLGREAVAKSKGGPYAVSIVRVDKEPSKAELAALMAIPEVMRSTIVRL